MVHNMLKKGVGVFYRLRFALQEPHDFVVTGLPRSGTSLLSAMLSDRDDCFCFNEIHYRVETLPLFFKRMRRRLIDGRPVPVKVDGGGGLTTDTMDPATTVRPVPFSPRPGGIILGSNVNIPYLNRIDDILAFRYRVVTMVRDPIFTIASWSSARSASIPEAHVTDGDLHPRWADFPFRSATPLGRRAELWEHYAAIIRDRDRRGKLLVVRYEDLCETTDAAVMRIADYLGLTRSAVSRALELRNRVTGSLNLDEIAEVVDRSCPTREYFGYGV